MLSGLLFDLDGTLIDSNGAHVLAWQRAFERYGYRVGPDLIFNHMGKGGDNFVPAVLGDEANKADGKALRKAEPEEFEKIVRARGIEVFPGAQDLMAAVRKLGIKTALATSSGEKQLSLAEECSGVKFSELVDEVVNSDDIKSSKPEPDLALAAAQKLKMSPAQCAILGDTPFDAESAKRAGVVCLGVTCGGHKPETLRSGGARAVWRDPADMLAHLDQALAIASPGPAILTQAMLEQLMQHALAAAEEAIGKREAPIGAVVARGDGTIIARGFNSLNSTGNKTAHAEIVAFANAAGKAPPQAADVILVSTLEPCVMCLGAAMEAGVDTVVFGAEAPADSGTRRVSPPQSPESNMPRIVGGILREKSIALFKKWLAVGNTSDQKQVQFVKQLLQLTA